jgi:carboxylesterase
VTGDVGPGREAFRFDGGPVGVLLLHGFTGSPASLRPLGERLAARGHAVACPLYPGHGRAWRDLAGPRWQDWAAEAERALADVATGTRNVVVFGQSFGAALALHLAARRPDVVRGLVLVNGYLRDRRIVAAPLLRFVLPSVKGVGNDIKRPGQDELAAERIPMRALAEVARFFRVLKGELHAVRQPVLVFASSEDHVVPKGTARWLLRRVGSERKELVELPNSYHVASLDNDADLVFRRTLEFVESLHPARRTS